MINATIIKCILFYDGNIYLVFLFCLFGSGICWCFQKFSWLEPTICVTKTVSENQPYFLQGLPCFMISVSACLCIKFLGDFIRHLYIVVRCIKTGFYSNIKLMAKFFPMLI